jgi:hypothetical protein
MSFVWFPVAIHDLSTDKAQLGPQDSGPLEETPIIAAAAILATEFHRYLVHP